MQLSISTRSDLAQRFRTRAGETKLGEKVQVIEQPANWQQELATSTARFVLLGLPEDIGVRANFGRGGAWSAWEPALNTILGVQSNRYFTGAELLVLGHIDFSDLMQQADALDFKKDEDVAKARALTAEVDARVFPVIQAICAAGKIPVVIGGGHNNAYPIIKGAALGLRDAKKNAEALINVMNCDAHSDFRTGEGRHSGNGFRYAWTEGYLDKYAMVGLQENYTPQAVLEELLANEEHFYVRSFDDMFIHNETVSSFGPPQMHDYFGQAVDEASRFTKKRCTGIELDMDIVQNMPASARTSSGISANQARQYVYHAAHAGTAAYFHIAEAAPVLAHRKADIKTGKLIAFLVTDFMKAVLEKDR